MATERAMLDCAAVGEMAAWKSCASAAEEERALETRAADVRFAVKSVGGAKEEWEMVRGGIDGRGQAKRRTRGCDGPGDVGGMKAGGGVDLSERLDAKAFSLISGEAAACASKERQPSLHHSSGKHHEQKSLRTCDLF